VLNRPRIESEVRNLAKKLFTGLEYLHSLGIGHRDIKFENIMVSSTEDDATPKFIDSDFQKYSSMVSIHKRGSGPLPTALHRYYWGRTTT
jgi:serine/threonine protein kinase